MTSLQAIAESIRAAVSSPSTCTPATAATLSELLLPKSNTQTTSATEATKKTSKPATAKPRTKKPVTKSKKAVAPAESIREDGGQLSPKERSILASAVINATLKSLNDSIKAPPVPPVKRQGSSKDLVKASARQALRRSSSMPQSPLQPRSLNRVSSSPNISTRESRSSSSASISLSSHRPTAECCRTAFACLRALQATKILEFDWPTLQLENGMSIMIGKLVNLGLDDLAIKEIRILKRRLDIGDTPKNGQSQKGPNTISSSTQSLAELLDFGNISYTGMRLGLVVTTQLQILRLLNSSRKPKLVEDALPILMHQYRSSPTRLLLQAAKDSTDEKHFEKIARQLQTLSDIQLSLCPSISMADDDVSLEPRLSISPEAAIRLQALGLHNRFLWWGIANHKGDLSKDIFDPFLRCLSTFSRRSQFEPVEKYELAQSLVKDLHMLVKDCFNPNPAPFKSTMAGIHKILGTLAKEADRLDTAIVWIEKVQAAIDTSVDSDAKRCSVAARLVSLHLRSRSRHSKEEERTFALLEQLERPFKGDSLEIDELMTEISGVRRAAIHFLSQHQVHGRDSLKGLCQMCESLVFICPRLSLRYLGTSPNSKATTKDLIRYEQRRQFITTLALFSIDSALFTVKASSSAGRMTWELIDSKLQDCLLLLDRLDVSLDEPAPGGTSPTSYYVKISNIYFSQYLNMRRSQGDAKESQQLKALRRSLDSIRSRSREERKAGQFSTKLERMAELCRATNRYDELFKTLIVLRDQIVEDGVLSSVAARYSTEPFTTIWNTDDGASTFARTLHSLLKVQLKYLKSGIPEEIIDISWGNEEKGAVLEHQLELIKAAPVDSSFIGDLRLATAQQLLTIYSKELYPIRRLRSMIRLLTLDCLDQCWEGGDMVDMELKALTTAEDLEGGTADEGLRRFKNHLRTMATSILEMRKEKPSFEILKQGLASWSTMRARSLSSYDFQQQVDDLDGLLSHLYSMSDFLQMQGNPSLRVAVLRLVADINELCEPISSPDDLAISFSKLGTQWLQLGYSGKAGLAFDRAARYSACNGITTFAKLEIHLAQSQYLLAIGSLEKAEQILISAHAVYPQLKDDMSKSKSMSALQHKTTTNLLISNAYMTYSMLSLHKGTPHIALSQAKQSLRLLRRAWSNVEEHLRFIFKGVATPTEEIEKLTEGMSQAHISAGSVSTESTEDLIPAGTSFWTLIDPLFRALNHISSIFAHHGMFQETLYYAEQAHKLARRVGSDGHLAVASTVLGDIFLKSGRLDKGSEYLMASKALSSSFGISPNSVNLELYLASMHKQLGDGDAVLSAYESAKSVLNGLTSTCYIRSLELTDTEGSALAEKMTGLAISKKKEPASRKTVARSRAAAARKVTERAKSPVEAASLVGEECAQLMSTKATIIRQIAESFTSKKRFAEALTILQEADNFVYTTNDALDQGLAMAKHLLSQSLEQMNVDPVYSVLQDSTISFPSVIGLSKTEKVGERLSAGRVSPTRKGQVTRVGRDNSKSPTPDSFFDKLRRAQELLIDLYPTSLQSAPLSMTHHISGLMSSVAILLSAAGQVKGKAVAFPSYASCSTETTRTQAIRRERKAMLVDPQPILKIDDSSWPQVSSNEHRRSSIISTSEVSKFQKDYIDLIPKSWTIISISLSDSRQELCITKLQAGNTPFILRLPLGRHNSIDADEEVFGFEQGHAELLDIIESANLSARDSQGRTSREAKAAWWEERNSLDARLRDLLENIEKVWLGGFTGIFSQHERKPELLARFQRSFQSILDRHLPSRRRTGRKSSSISANLDSRILNLFIGLGDASDEEFDLSEPLTDLLYFVVDVLQFHGELNAYAEIDFDSIVVDMLDALRAYHDAARSSGSETQGRHTILILDKTLHSFPWESLPCMDGLAVSRLPSLGCLRDRLTGRSKLKDESDLEGHFVHRNSGSYILNPGGDLKSTQTVFQKTLENFDDWEGVVNREPSEDEFKFNLSSKDLLLYFGHGSGAQYIRAREIRKLNNCAVTFLMGCSSGALEQAGEFEPYGPSINYMHAGCPALVATLWDVTDKDIDRFAKSTFEHWGLFPEEKTSKGRGRKRVEIAERKLSVVEAVAKGKSACTLRYLNGASVCVYGIPVYLK